MPLNTSSSPLVSVVTPAYNEEKYLPECIESVLAQSYPYWDYLIVNNCSTDGTLAIAKKYAARDPRIRVISNNTLIPAVANFNHALRRISSESKYCKIVFGDDWLFPECLERMVSQMEDHPSIGIVGAYGLQGQWVLWQGLPYGSKFISGREICRQGLLGGPYVFGSATSVLFRSDLVRNRDPFYNESNPYASDSEACFELLRDCDFGFVSQVLTFSREREGSMLASSRRLNTAAADALHQLVAYGPYYLGSDEYRHRLSTIETRYYEFLASSFLEGRNKEFWNYHKKTLKEEGIEFSYARIGYMVGKRMLGRLRPTRQKPTTPQWGL